MFKVYIRRIIYDPVVARILYDLGVAYGILIFLYTLFLAFGQQPLRLAEIIIFPLLFVLFNYLIGLYGRFKMASIRLKAMILLTSGLTALLFFEFNTSLSLPLVIATFFIIFSTITPRAFLNFHKSHTSNQSINQIILTNSPVLVVGGGGYIGTQVVEKLLQKNYRVRVFDKFLYSREVFADLEKNRNLEIIEGDISDLYSLTMALRNVQAVIHLAGIVGDPAAAVDERLTRHVNIISTRMLKESVKAFRIPRFIFASSCSVYGASTKLVNENSVLKPVSLYAQTKIDSEKELLQDTFDAFHPTILRFATVFGHSRKPRFDLVANLFVAQAYTTGKITLFNGEQWRPFVHVSDVAEGIIKTFMAPLEKTSRQIYNVGDDSLHFTIEDLAHIVKNVLEAERKVTIIKERTNVDRRNYRVSFKKIEENLGFRATISMEEGIREIFQQFKNLSYKKGYKDPYYSNFEMMKEIRKEFYSKEYQRKHFSTIS